MNCSLEQLKLNVERGSMNKIAGTHKLLISLIAISGLASISACSRGGNHPDDWKSTSITKLACQSHEVFDLNKLQIGRADKLQKASEENPAVPEMYVVRTMVTKDVVTGENYNQIKAGSVIAYDRPFAEHSIAEFSQSKLKPRISSEKGNAAGVDCENLTATYDGPGVAGPVSGRVTGISHKGIRIEADSPSTKSHVKIELSIDRPKRQRSSRADHNKYKENYEKGIFVLNISITETLQSENGPISHIVEIRQESNLNENIEVTVHPAVLGPLFARVLEKGNITEDIKLMMAETEKAKDTVTFKISQLLMLTDAAMGPDDRQPGDGRPVDPQAPVTQPTAPGTDGAAAGDSAASYYRLDGNTCKDIRTGLEVDQSFCKASSGFGGSSAIPSGANGTSSGVASGTPAANIAVTGESTAPGVGTSVTVESITLPGSTPESLINGVTSAGASSTAGSSSVASANTNAANKSMLEKSSDTIRAVTPDIVIDTESELIEGGFNIYKGLNATKLEWTANYNTNKAEEKTAELKEKTAQIENLQKEISALESKDRNFWDNYQLGKKKNQLATAKSEIIILNKEIAHHTELANKQKAAAEKARTEVAISRGEDK